MPYNSVADGDRLTAVVLLSASSPLIQQQSSTMHRTATLQRLVSTSHGQRRILKYNPPVVKYIRQAIESGTYPPSEVEKERKNKPYGTNFRDYPIEYEILTLFPPIPPPPRIPKKLRGARKSKQALPTEHLVKEYLHRMKDQKDLSEEEYYERLLGIPPPSPTTAMGRKSAVLNKAYAFALKQFEVMRQDDGITEEESIAIVEDLLAKEKKTERYTSRSHANEVKQWRQQEAPRETSKPDAPLYDDPSSVPSILHSKPRAIEGMAMWSHRLRAVPYKEWTIGATTALDHWIARSILNLEEDTWQELLEGDNPSLFGHGHDILTVRQSLFPETILGEREREHQQQPQQPTQEDTSEDKSIDELLASLGGFDDYEDKDAFWPSETTVGDGNMDQKVSSLIHELQNWRAKNMDSPYEEWSAANKDEFAAWLDNYVTTMSSKREEKVDMVATRKALLSSPPLAKDESDKFWQEVRDETDAEILLQSMRKEGAPSPQGYTGVERKAREAFGLFQHLPYEVQLQKLVDLGTLRPIMDEYTSESERIKFLARYGEKLMEGVEMEHLVPDPEGPIYGEELGKWGEENGVGKDERFRMSMVKYGTDEFGTGRSDRAREMCHAWNTHKAGRARFEEIMFKQGRLGLRYNLDKKKKVTRK